MTVFGFQRHDHFIPSSDHAELTLRLREVSPLSNEQASKAVLCIHGAVLHSVMFDLPGPDMSWLESFAKSGINAFSLDLRGYGHSSKVKVLQMAEESGTMACTHEEALRDIHDAVMFIKKHLMVEQVHLVGLSWGSVLVGSFFEKYPDLVGKILFLGPVYSMKNPAWIALMDPDNPNKVHPSLGASRVVTRETLFFLWDKEIPYEKKSLMRHEDVEYAILEELLQSDREWNATRDHPSARVPTGVWKDIEKIYNEEPLYNAQNVTCPILIMRGEFDQASLTLDVQGLFEKLGSKEKAYLQVGNATHYGLAERRSAPFMIRQALEFFHAKG